MDTKLDLNICLSDILESAIYVSKNGKKYLSARLVPRKSIGEYGETHFIALIQTKEQRDAQVKPDYIGKAKPVEYKNT